MKKQEKRRYTMRYLIMMVVVTMLSTACGAARSEGFDVDQNKSLEMERMGVYISSNDLNHSLEFYQVVFGISPEVKTPSFLGFDISGGLFAIVDKETFAPEATYGNNAVPYIRVSNLSEVHARTKEIVFPPAQVSEIIYEDYLSLFKLTDSDGNIVEFYEINLLDE